MDESRLNIANGEYTLKLGNTFPNQNSKNMFHTLKYDFKPASVNVNKDATLQISSNSQVTVTAPNLDTSGVPNTIFKGNQREYSKKEFVLIIDRDTNEITLEKLHNNLQVKKTRTDSSQSKPVSSIITNKVENQTARLSSKTRVSTGVRKNVVSFVPRSPPLQGSPLNSSHSYSHRSPQQAPLWNANNTQQTLPSIPLIGMDDFNVSPMPQMYSKSGGSSSGPSSQVLTKPSSSSSSMQPQQNLPVQMQHNQQQQQFYEQQQQHQHQAQQQQPQASQSQQQQPQQQILGGMAMHDNHEVGVLSTSDSSSSEDSDDSDSDSDSNDTDDDDGRGGPNSAANTNNNLNINNNLLHSGTGTTHSPININNHVGSMETLKNDLDLSSSNSDSDY